MKKRTSLLFLAILCTLFFNRFSAQNYLGVHASNYAGVMALDNQPASFVDGRFKFDMNIASVNFGFWNNARYFNPKDMPAWWIPSLTTNKDWKQPDSSFYSRFIKPNGDYNSAKQVKGLYTNYQVDLINFAFHVTPKIALGFSAKSRMVANVDNMDPKFLSLIENGLSNADLFNLPLSNKHLTGSALLWNEYGINYGQVLSDKGKHFFKTGIRLKLLQGLGSMYAYTQGIDYNLSSADSAASIKANVEYGYSNNLDNYPSKNTSDFLKTNSNLGFGMDIGFVYEFRPRYKDFQYEMDGKKDIWMKDKEKYALRIGASLLDIGGMKFTKGGNSRDFNVNTTAMDLRVFKDNFSFQHIDTIVDSLLTNDPGWKQTQTKGQKYYMNTPTALSLQVDYHVWKWFYVNATGMINVLSSQNSSKVHVPNQFALTPSFDYEWFGLHVPISVNSYSGWKTGIAARFGPLTVGMIDLNAIFKTGHVNGGEFFAGLRIPILYTAPSDIDNDKVSDKMDNCVDVPGVWSFKGCPDTDMDGVQDSEDICPQIAGLAEFKGCPDKDGDKIPDKDDACPDLAGLAKFKGCPDRDNDSIADPQDDCPDTPGIIAFNGCPDTDGDGVKDSEDACPDVAGPLVNQGCPDTDNDGLFDFLDNCPKQFGPKENNGCPWPDTDKDGLLDKDDECPLLAGPIKNKGCPYKDTDGDGILDKDDDCPTVKGVIENKGCPKIEAAAQEILKTAFEDLEFNTGNAVIKETSFASLDELAGLLVKKKEWKLQIAGHTDNVGDAQKNLILSKQRAESVKTYLVSKGVDVKRLNTLFFGETQPIATNETTEGRQKNRRVEMTVIFE